MGYLKNLYNSLVGKAGVDVQRKPTGYETAGYSLFGGNDPQVREYLNEMRGWVYACVNAIADEIGSIELKLFRDKGNGQIEEVTKHELLDILYRVNGFTTKFDHFWLTTAYLELAGEAPWFLEKEGNTIVGIYFLQPDRIEPIPDKNNVIAGYKYDLGNGERVNLAPDEVIFLKNPNPANPFRGLSTLKAAAKTVDIDNQSEEWNLKFYKNSARPDSILTVKNTEMMDEEQKEKLKASIRKTTQGTEKAHNLLVLFGDMEMTPYAVSVKDMDFLELSKFNRDKILGLFRVPKAIIAQTEGVNFASAQVAQYSFARWTIQPKLERLVQQLNEFLVPMFPDTENMFLDYVNVLPEDDNAKVTHLTNAVYKWMTVNEVRQLEGMDSVPGGDIIYAPSGFQPMVDTITGELINDPTDLPEPVVTPPAGSGRPVAEKPSDKPTDKPADKKPTDSGKKFLVHSDRLHQLHARSKDYYQSLDMRKRMKDKIKQQLRAEILKKRVSKKEYKQIEEEKKKAFWEIKNKVFENYMPKVKIGMQEAFRQQHKQVMSKLEDEKSVPINIKKVTVNVKKLLLDKKAEEKRLAVEVLPVLTKLFKEAGDETLSFIGTGSTFDMDTPEIIKLLKADNRLLAVGTTETTNDLIAFAVAEGLKYEESISEIGKRISEVFKEADQARAETIARTEAIRFNVSATEEAFKQSGVVAAKQWQINPSACEQCQAYQGKIVSLDETFLDKGDSDPTGVVNTYANVFGPPLHTNCRCDLVPVFVAT